MTTTTHHGHDHHHDHGHNMITIVLAVLKQYMMSDRQSGRCERTSRSIPPNSIPWLQHLVAKRGPEDPALEGILAFQRR